MSKIGAPVARAVDRTILRAAFSVGLAAALVKLVAAGKEMVVAAAYGRSDALDAFLVAFLLPGLMVNIISESMNQALVPTLIRVREREGKAAAQRLLSSSMLWMCGFLVAVSVGVAASVPILFPTIASNFAPDKLALSERLFCALLPMVLLSGIASNCTAVLNSCDRFLWPALAAMVVPVATMGMVFGASARFGIWAMVWGSLLGVLLHAVLVAGGMQRNGYRFSLRWHGRNEAAGEVGRQYGPVLFSGIVASGGLLVDQAMAASLPTGSVSALAYASRFVGVFLALLAGGISTAIMPSLSRMVAHGEWLRCRQTTQRWVLLSFLVSLLPMALLIAFRHNLIAWTLQHGAFGAGDTAVVARVLAMYALQIPFFVASRVDYRMIVAARRTDLILRCGMVNLVLDVLFNLIFMRSMGIAGIALSTSLWTVSTFLLLRFWALRLTGAGASATAEAKR